MSSSGEEVQPHKRLRTKPSRKSLYDRQSMEKNIFWDAYCEIEKHRNEETQVDANHEFESQLKLASSLNSVKGRRGSGIQSSTKQNRHSGQPVSSQFSQIIGSSTSSFQSDFSWANNDQRFSNYHLLKRGRSRGILFCACFGFIFKVWFYLRSFINLFRDRDIFDNEGLLDINDANIKAEWREKRKKKYLEDREFRLFFIEKTKLICISVLTFALCAVSVAVIMIIASLQRTQSDGQNLRSSVLALAILPIIWILFFILCLYFFISFCYFRRSDSEQSRNAWYNGWIGIGRLILYSRVLILCYNISHSIMSSRVCYTYEFQASVNAEQIFNAYLIIMCMDIFNVIVLSVMPFPWPWAVYLNAVQYTEELLRIYSCKDIFGGNAFNGYINTCMMNVAITMIITGIFTSYSFERCVRSSYKNIQDQNIAAQEKMMLVNMLCRDVKAPTQQFVQIFQSMEGVLSRTPIDLRQYTQSLQGITKSVNLIVDDILFLVRVEEGRFIYQCTSKVHIPSMLSSIYDALKIATMLGTEEIVDEQMFETTLGEDTIRTENNCLRVLLYYGLLATVELVTTQLLRPGNNSIPMKMNQEVPSMNSLQKNVPQSVISQVPSHGSGKNPLVTSTQQPIPHDGIESPMRSSKPVVVRAPPKSILIKFERLTTPKSIFDALKLKHQSKKVDSEVTHSHRYYTLKVSIILRDPRRSFALMDLSRNSLIESVCVISQRLVDTCGGSFELFENRIEFTLLCKENGEDAEDDDPTTFNIPTVSTDGPIAITRRHLNGGNINVEKSTTINSKSFSSADGHIIESANNSLRTASGKLSKSNSLLIPANLLMASRSTISESTAVNHSQVSSSSSDFSGNVKQISIPLEDIKKQLNSYIPKSIYVYGSEAGLLGLLKDVVESLPGGSDVFFHSDLSAAQLKIHSIVFAQSVAACLEVKEKKFAGKIVLFSERLSYLDEAEKRYFDYGVSLPCNDDDIMGLLRWLYIRSLKDSAISDDHNLNIQPIKASSPKAIMSRKRKVYTSLILQDILAIGSNIWSHFEFPKWLGCGTGNEKENKVQVNGGIFGASRNNEVDLWMRIINMFQVIIPRSRLDSYGQWKLMNPGQSWFHHTYQFEASVIVVLVMSIFSWQSGVITIQYIGSFVFYFFSLLFRRLFYNFIIKYTSIKFLTWWKLCCYWDFFFTIFSFIGEFLIFNTGSRFSHLNIGVQQYTPDNIDTMTFAMFLNKKRGKLTGSESMFSLVYFPGWMKLTVEFVPWPMCYIAILTYFIRSLFLFLNILVHFVTKGLLGFMIWLLISLCITVSIILYYNERIYREEFTELYELIKSKDFLDKCLQSSRRGLFVPMKKLDSTFKALMKDVVTCAIHDSFFVGYELLSKFEQLKMNVLISKELSYSLRVADGKFFRRPLSAIFHAMHDVYIRDIVQHVCSSFMLSHNKSGFIRDNEINCSIADLSLSIYFHLHPSLTMVKIDEELLSALLCNGCRTAIARIQETIQASPKHQGYVHQLLIWIEPSRLTEVQKFTDVKVLEVYVLDTGLIVPRKDDDENEEIELENEEFDDLEEITPYFNVTNGESRMDRAKGAPLFQYVRRSSVLRSGRDKNSHTYGDETTPPSRKGLNTYQSSLSSVKKFRYTGGQVICDKYMKFFMLPLRFETGRVRHSQFRSFQRFGVPYMLCRDSNKYDQWFITSDDQLMTLINHNKKLQFYSKYLTSYGDNLEIILLQQARRMQKDAIAAGTFAGAGGSSILRSGKIISIASVNQLNQSTKTSNTNPSTTSRKRRRKFEGIVTIYAKLGGELSQAILENKRIFNQLGWKCRMSPLKDLPSMASLADVDCVIMESDITTRAWSYDFRDLIHYLRSNGFQGVIIVAVTKSLVSSSSNAPHFAPGQSIVKPNSGNGSAGFVFRDALATETPDMFLAVPFGSFEVKNIVKSIEERILSLFISPA